MLSAELSLTLVNDKVKIDAFNFERFAGQEFWTEKFVEDAIYQLFVKTLTGKTITVDARPKDTVYRTKIRIEKTEDLPPEQQRSVIHSQ